MKKAKVTLLTGEKTMKTTTKTLKAAHKKALEIATDKNLIQKDSSMITIWVGEDDQIWDEASETYSPSVAKFTADRLVETFGMISIYSGSKYILTCEPIPNYCND